jgi:hypothetical protein
LTVELTEEGYKYRADDKHRDLLMEYFGFKDNSAPLVCNGEKDVKEEEWHKELLGKSESTTYRGLAARLNYMSQD